MKNIPMTRRILNLLLVGLFLLPCLAFAGEPEPMTTGPAYGAMEFKAGEIIVKFREGISQASVQSLLLAEELEILDEMDKLGLMLLSVPKGQELAKIEELKRNHLVEYAELNHMIQVRNALAAEPHYGLRAPDVFPNDLHFPSQWNLAKIEAPAAWEITTGSNKVVIAVIGAGVDLDHPELKDKIWTNPGETGTDTNGNDKATNGIDDDGNGYVDDVHGWDFVNQHGEPQDDHWHGTFVATIAAAETNNGVATAGVSWRAEIMPVVTDGTSVVFETSLGSFDGIAVTKNTTNGIAAATLPSQVSGMATITATSDSKVATTTVEFEPDSPYTVTLVAYPMSLTLGSSSSLTATVKDQYNNNVADGTVVGFETSLGSLGSTTVTKTTVSGVATATLTSEVVGTAVVTATSDSKYDTANVVFKPGPPYTVTVEAYPTSIPIGGFTSTITAMVKDQYGNLVPDGTVVTFTTDLGSLGLGSSSVVKTTVNGVATTTLTSGLIIGPANVSATSDSAVGQTQVIFIWNGGIAGVSWGAEIMPIKFIEVLPDGSASGPISDLNEGIKYAADNGARILILDFQIDVYVESVEDAIDYAYGEGTLLVAGAGNCGMENACGDGITNPVMYPGAFPQVLAVAATSRNDEHMNFSEHHPYVDVAAPGERIPGFTLDSYALLPGTYFAAAHVAGLAALIWSVNSDLTNDEVESIIKSTAVDQVGDPAKDTPGWDEYFGHGRIDAAAAVMATPCYLQVEPDSLHFLVCDDTNPPPQTITSTSPCTWSVTGTVPWLSISPLEGYTTTVSIDIGSLPDYDVYTATITATSTLPSCVNSPLTIPVTVVYTQCWRSYLPLLFKKHGPY